MTLSVQILLLILLAGVIGAFGMFCAMKAMGYSKPNLLKIQGEEEDRQKQLYRISRIKMWADMRMESVPKQCQHPEYRILVKRSDLLTIWDMCCKLEEHM